MKQRKGKGKKQRLLTNTSTAKTACGTLSYIAECRGTQQKDTSVRWTAPPEENNRLVRTYPPTNDRGGFSVFGQFNRKEVSQ